MSFCIKMNGKLAHGPSIFNSVEGGKSGTAILFNTRQVNIKQRLLDNLGRTIALDVDFGGNVLHLVNTYFPNSIRDKYSFLFNLQPYFISMYPIVWGGDQNISIDNMIDRLPARTGKDKYADEIANIISSFDLVDVCRFLYPTQKMFTYVQGEVQSRIDKICVST